MYVKVHNTLRKVIGLSSEVLRVTSDTTVLHKPEITTPRIDYIKVLSGETVDVAEMSEAEKLAVDAELAATQAELLTKAIDVKLNNLKELFELTIAKIDKYPVTEMISWEKQLAEANAYSLDQNAPIPLITQIASERTDLGELLVDRIDELVTRIIQNNIIYITLSGLLIGRRHVMEINIKAATSQVNLPTTEAMRDELNSVLAAGIASLP